MEHLHADWVFGYGSLIWNPEFEFTESSLAKVHGYHRAFCVRSTLYRGTPENPGVVLGLNQGGCVQGLAFKIAPNQHKTAIATLYAREMIQSIYEPKVLKARLPDGRYVRALTFVANRKVESYQELTECEIVARLAGCRGNRGPNIDYAINTYQSLKKLGVNDPSLARLVARLQTSSVA